MRRFALLLPLGLAACVQSEPVYMRNATTGQVVKCGPYVNNDLKATAAALHEQQCVQDYKEQGFVRIPAPR